MKNIYCLGFFKRGYENLELHSPKSLNLIIFGQLLLLCSGLDITVLFKINMVFKDTWKTTLFEQF